MYIKNIAIGLIHDKFTLQTWELDHTLQRRQIPYKNSSLEVLEIQITNMAHSLYVTSKSSLV